MSEIVGKYRIEVDQTVANLKKVADEIDRTDAKAAKAGKSLSDSFIKGSEGAKRLEAELAKQPKTLAEMELKLQRLKELLRDDTKIGTEGFRQVTKAINDTTSAIDKANKEFKETNTLGKGLISTFKSVGLALGVAFGVQQIIAFGKEAVLLAAKAEGVERAFKRIGDASLLNELRAATRGTVSDFVLMQNAVKAENFNIPLKQLGTLLKYAQIQAAATGKDVDYLVESLIDGIGKKSTVILDNLQISGVELRETLGDVSLEAANIGQVAEAVGKIAGKAIEEMGNQALTTADKLAKLDAVWKNFMVNAGDALINFGTGWAYLLGLVDTGIGKFDGAKKAFENLKQIWADGFETGYRTLTDLYLEIEKQQERINDLIKQRTELLNTQTAFNGGSVRKQQSALNEELRIQQMRLQALREIFIEEQNQQKAKAAGGSRDSEIRNVFFLKAAIADLTTEIEAEGTAIKDIMPLIDQRKKLEEELARLLGTAPKPKIQNTGIALLNEQLSTLKTELSSAAIGGSEFWAIVDKIDKKIKELTRAESMTKLVEALKVDDQKAADKAMDDPRIARDIAASQSDYDMWQAKKKNAEDYDAWLKAKMEQQLQDQLDADAALIESDEERREKEKAAFLEFAQFTQDIISTISMAVQQGYEQDMRNLDEQLESGQLSREEYDRKRRGLERKKAADDKSAAIFSAVVGTAVAVVQALGAGPIIGYILAGLTAALGAVQIGIIASQPLPAFAEGGRVDKETGLITGRKHKQGGVKIEAEGGEFITNATQSSKHSDLLEAINKGIAERFIMQTYVKPALDRALLNGMSDMGRSAEMNGLTANLKDTNILHALDRNRRATVIGLDRIHEQLSRTNRHKRGGYA